MQINLSKVKKYGLRALPWVIAASALLFHKCAADKTDSAISLLTTINNAGVKKISELKIKNDSLDKVNQRNEDTIRLLRAANAKKRVQIDRLRSDAAKAVARVKSMNRKEKRDFFADRYSMPDQVSVTQDGLAMKDSICDPVITDLITGDAAKQELDLTKDMLSNEQASGELKDTIIANKDKKIGNLEEQGRIKDDNQKISDYVIKEQNQQLNKVSKQNALLKIGVPAGVILGFVTGVLISN